VRNGRGRDARGYFPPGALTGVRGVADGLVDLPPGAPTSGVVAILRQYLGTP
jgi:hypothetical protein